MLNYTTTPPGSQVALIQTLVSNGIVKSSRLVQCLESVDRLQFLGSEAIDSAVADNDKDPNIEFKMLSEISHPYIDRPQYLGYNTTISAPHMHAHALNLLNDHLFPGAKVLDVGSGSGYLCAAMAMLVRRSVIPEEKDEKKKKATITEEESATSSSSSTPSPKLSTPHEHFKGLVVGVEHVPQLVKRSIRALRRSHPDLLDDNLIKIMCLDARMPFQATNDQDREKLIANIKKLSEIGPFDAIHIGCAVPSDPTTHSVPQDLIDLLNNNGKLILPLGEGHQLYMSVTKNETGEVDIENLFGVRYVPLTSYTAQISS